MGIKNINMVMGLKEWLLIVLLSVMWGSSFLFVQIVVKTMPPLTIVLFRVGVAALILHLFVFSTGRVMPGEIKIWKAFFVLGAINNVIPFVLITWGQNHIGASLASILNATTPIFSVMLAHFLTRDEKLTKNRFAGVLLGWSGVVVLIGVDALLGVGMKTWGQAVVLFAALSYAFGAIFARRLNDIDPLVMAAGMLTASTVILFPLVFLFESPFLLTPDGLTWISLCSLSLISTAFAYIIYFYILSKAGATNILLVTFLIPISAIFFGVMILHETLGWNVFAGMALIFAGLIFIDGRLLKLKLK